ncbi:MAG: hypothetical protein IPO21_21260 [Bacteroidales bacterium]|nr:hypothetical protein [Bacteroidales bacterium]
MSEEKDHSAEELRRRIQERLNSLNKQDEEKTKEASELDESKNKVEEIKPEATTSSFVSEPTSETSYNQQSTESAYSGIENKSEEVKAEIKEEVKEEVKEIPTETVKETIAANTAKESEIATSKFESAKKVEQKIEEKKKPIPVKAKTTASSSSFSKKKTDYDNSGSAENVKQKSKSSVVILLAVLLLGVSGLFFWQYMQTNKVESKNTELVTENTHLKEIKEDLNRQLQEMLAQYESVKTSNKELNMTLQEEKQKIKELLEQINKLEEKGAKVDYYRAQANQLSKSKDHYLHRIDSLAKINEILVTRNEELNSEFEKSKSENELLSGKVELASKVKGVNLKAYTYNEKGKVNDKNKAKKITTIEVCITLIANPLAPKGDRDIYLRVVEPNGNILVESKDNLFSLNGTEVAFTALGSVNYQNEEVNTCIKYKLNKELAIGNYDIEVYTDGQRLGATNIVVE